MVAKSKPGKGDPDATYVKLELNHGEVAESQAAAFQRKGLEHYRNAGKRLAAVREQCKQKDHPYYKNWLGWLKDNGIDQQRENECRRLHDGWEKLPLGGNFSLKEALRIIRGGNTGTDTSTENAAEQPTADKSTSSESESAKPKNGKSTRRTVRASVQPDDDELGVGSTEGTSGGSETIKHPYFGIVTEEESAEGEELLAVIKGKHGVSDGRAIWMAVVHFAKVLEAEPRKGGAACETLS